MKITSLRVLEQVNGDDWRPNWLLTFLIFGLLVFGATAIGAMVWALWRVLT